MAFIKMTQSIMGCEQGRVYDLDDDIARTLVATKKAEGISASEFIQASRKADDESLRASIKADIGAEVLRLMEAMGTAGRPNGDGASAATRALPPGGGGVNFDQIASGADPAVRANEIFLGRIKESKARGIDGGIGEVLGLVGIVGKPSLFAPAQVQFAQRRLQNLCGEATEQIFNESTGKWDHRKTRDLADGGIEVITRTGTDSLSGGTTYGFALKPEYLGNLFEVSMEQQVFVNAATNIPVSSGNEVRWPAWDQYQAPTLTNGLMQPAVVAGVTLYYEGEIAPRVATDANLNSINFKVVDLTAFTALSRDFVVDNYLAFDAALTRMIGRAFGWMEDWVSIQGPGVGRPQGYFNSGATLVVNRASSTYKISSNDLTSMIAAASPMVWNELRWITNVSAVPYLAILTNSAGTPVFQPNALITQAQMFSIMDKSRGGVGAELMHRPMGTLLGFPVYFSEKVSQVGNTGDLSLVAPSQYGVARRSGLEIAVSEHFYFDTDRIAYRMKQRHDMKSLWRAPYIQADNPTTLASGTQVSPFVILH